MTSKPLDGTVALITGASSGIGEETARHLAAQGATVALLARRKDRLDELAQEIEAAGGAALPIVVDVTEQAAAVAAVERVAAELGRIDTVVNNAGIMLLGPIEGADLGDWNTMVDLNLKGLLYVAHAALPHLLEAAETSPRRVADLVNISSVAGRVANAGSGVYNLTKFGVGAFSESLRKEVTQRHVRVSLVEPGAVETELTNHLSEAAAAGVAKRFEGLEKLQAPDVARAIEYIVTQPRHVAINELLIRPTDQEG